MISGSLPKVSSSVAQAIQEAILLGGDDEIEAVLESVKDDETFPVTLRYGLEALLYFRRYYGEGKELEPKDKEKKRKACDMESSWGRELIESLTYYSDADLERHVS
ncbi:MAG: hypothetical protein PHS57_03565 [Alphaproteobacteria bacterium]|nr:hypothetical protein [Alphaproteobacteria bacterium]